MVAGQWTNQDGLPLNFGTQKTLPEFGGEYLLYGGNRVIETYIAAGPTFFGTGTNATPLTSTMANGFTGTGTPQSAGIVSQTFLFPLQTTTVGAGTGGGFVANSAGQLILNQTQIWVDEIDFEVLTTFSAGASGTATTFTIGLVCWTGSAWAQVTPNAGVQLLGTATLSNLTVGKQWRYVSDASTATTNPFGSASANAPTAPAWVGNIPLVSNSITPLPQSAYISAVANGTFAGSGAGGLAKLKVYYNTFGTITQ